MKPLFYAFSMTLVALASSVLLPSSNAQTLWTAFENPAPSVGNIAAYPHNGPWVMGLDFQVISPTQVYSLGAYDSGQDGIFDQTVNVAIYDIATRLSVTPEVDFTTASPGTLIGGSRFKPITPVTLSPGNYSVVAAYYGWGSGTGEPFVDYWWAPVGAPPPVFYDGSGGPAASQETTYRFNVGAGLMLPRLVINTSDYPIYCAGTFQFEGRLSNLYEAGIPEPKQYGLFSGLLLIGFGGWRWFRREVVWGARPDPARRET